MNIPNLEPFIGRTEGSSKISMSPIWAIRGTKNQKGYPVLASCGDHYLSSNGDDELFNSLNDKQKIIFLINDPILKQTDNYCTFSIDWYTKNNKTIRLEAWVEKSEKNAPKSLKILLTFYTNTYQL
jgi:hypothetical protein